MIEASTAILAAVRILVMVLGLAIAIVSYQAYRRTGAPYLRDVSIGFTVVALGVFSEGVLFELFGWELVTVHIIESILVALGFAIILYSFYR